MELSSSVWEDVGLLLKEVVFYTGLVGIISALGFIGEGSSLTIVWCSVFVSKEIEFLGATGLAFGLIIDWTLGFGGD